MVIENTGSSRSSAPTGLFRSGLVVIQAKPMQLGVGARRAFGGQAYGLDAPGASNVGKSLDELLGEVAE